MRTSHGKNAHLCSPTRIAILRTLATSAKGASSATPWLKIARVTRFTLQSIRAPVPRSRACGYFDVGCSALSVKPASGYRKSATQGNASSNHTPFTMSFALQLRCDCSAMLCPGLAQLLFGYKWPCNKLTWGGASYQQLDWEPGRQCPRHGKSLPRWSEVATHLSSARWPLSKGNPYLLPHRNCQRLQGYGEPPAWPWSCRRSIQEGLSI